MNIIIFNKYLFIKNNQVKLYKSPHNNRFTVPQIFSSSDIKFNPGFFNLTTEYRKSSFFKYYIQIVNSIIAFTGSSFRTPLLYFHNFTKSSLKFRKRSNIYFTLLLNLKFHRTKFFFKLPIYLNFLASMSKQLYHVYKIKAGLIGIKQSGCRTILYVLNPHYFYSYLNNLKISKDKLIVKIYFDSLNAKLTKQIFSFLY